MAFKKANAVIPGKNGSLDPNFLRELSNKYAKRGKDVPDYFVNEKKDSFSDKLCHLQISLAATQLEIMALWSKGLLPKQFNHSFNRPLDFAVNAGKVWGQANSDDERTKLAAFGNAKLLYHIIATDLEKEAAALMNVRSR